MKKALIPVLLGVAMTACASPSSDNAAAGDAQVAKAIQAAEQATARVEEVGFAWRDTGSMIKKAKEAAEKGKSEEALALANQAKQQSELAWAQYQENKDPAPRF